MENKPNESNNKSKNFFKKEGFYLVLFICLCIVAVVAAITIRNNDKVATNPPTVQEQIASNGENAEVANASEEGLQDYEGAELVNNDKNENVKLAVAEGEKFDEVTASVSSSNVIKFAKPLEGKIVRKYCEIPTYFDTGSNEKVTKYRTNFGIHIGAKLGSPVVSAFSGKVEFIGDSPKHNGMTVVIDHENGYKTVYSNLDTNIKVKEGEKVKKGQELGAVGNTTVKAAFESYGEHLYFAMLKGKGSFKELDANGKYIDPTEHLSYEIE